MQRINIMDKEQLIEYWIKSSEMDMKTMNHLFETADYHWALFIGHLVIEKLLKALYIKNKDINVPRIHDLARICVLSGVILTDEIEDTFDLITTFNINARYPDYKLAFYNKCTRDFTHQSIKKIIEAREWILNQLTKK